LTRDAQFVVEPREPAVVRRHAPGEELERDRLIEREIVGAIDFAHATASEQGDEAVAAGDDGSGREPAPGGRPARAARSGRGPGGCSGGRERRVAIAVDIWVGPAFRARPRAC
jgi:hypothetical protein